MRQTYLFVVICLSLFLSCSSQSNSTISDKNKEVSSGIKIDTIELGEVVYNMDEKIWVVYQDVKDNYWFGSNGNGVLFYNGEELRRFSMKDGLVDNTIRGIQEDHLGNIFIEAHDGISRFDGEAFVTLDPIISDSNKWKMNPNDLWFNCNGNANGVYRFDGVKLIELPLPIGNLNEAFGREVKGVPFENMNNSPYAVYGIDKDKDGNLWIGTVAAGAFRYE